MLSEDDQSLLITPANRTILLQVLDSQSRMIMRFGKLDDRLQLLAEPFIEENNSASAAEDADNTTKSDDELAKRFPQTLELRQKALEFVSRTSRYPAYLRWAIWDQKKAEELLASLVASNNFLHELLNNHQLELLRLQELQTSFLIIQLNNKVDQLQEIVQAGLLPLRLGANEQPAPSRTGAVEFRHFKSESTLVSKLVELGRLKALASAADNGYLTRDFRATVGLRPEQADGLPLQWRAGDVTVIPGEDERGEVGQRRAPAWFHPPQQLRQRVWVEWKRADPRHAYNPANGPDPATLRRFQALVTLLRQHSETRLLRAPPCLGYFLDNAPATGIRYGLLFRAPDGVDSDTIPRTLRDALVGTEPVPSLTIRLALLRKLAQAVEQLHAVNWLHKGLSSDNVLFLDGSGADPAEPYLGGFDFSRPGGAVSMSSDATGSPAEDLYRHPGVQGSPREGSRGLGFSKRHDIYSLGVVMVEVARWEPIEAILGIGSREIAKARDVIQARLKLLGREQVERLKASVGDLPATAIVACLTGVTAFGLAEADDETNGPTAARLQMAFSQVVTKPLMDVRI